MPLDYLFQNLDQTNGAKCVEAGKIISNSLHIQITQDTLNGYSQNETTEIVNKVSIPLEEYLDLPNFFNKLRMPNKLQPIFKEIVKVIDKNEEYPLDMPMGDEIYTILFESNVDSKQKIKILRAIVVGVALWTVNTRGKDRKSIEPLSYE